MIRITLALTGAPAELAFSAATAHACNGVTACPDLPTRRPDLLRAVGLTGAVLMRVRRCPPVRVDAPPRAEECDTRHMTTGHARQKGGSS
jgi:hypothetical protein